MKFISNRGGGGFTGIKRGQHAFGGPDAHRFTGHVNSDIENGKVKPDAPKTQLYNLAKDPKQLTNVVRENPEVAERMRKRMQDILENSTAPHTSLN